jgi:hypothetical protein
VPATKHLPHLKRLDRPVKCPRLMRVAISISRGRTITKTIGETGHVWRFPSI